MKTMLGSSTATPSTVHDPEEVHRAAVRVMSPHRMFLPPRTSSLPGVIRASSNTAGMGLLYFEYGVPTEITSDPLEGYSTVHLPLAGTIEARIGGEIVTAVAGQGIVFSHGLPVDMKWSGDLKLLVARFEQNAILERLQAMVPFDPSIPLVFDPHLRAEGVASSVTSTIFAMERLLREAEGHRLPPAVARQFESTAISTLLLAHRHSYTKCLTNPIPLPAPRVVRAATDFIIDRFADDITSTDIARAAGVSERALYAAFRRKFGVSPVKYLRQYRLDAARKLLVDAAPDVTITEIAATCGFHHLGRFAAQYRDRFSESPRATRVRAAAPRPRPGIGG